MTRPLMICSSLKPITPYFIDPYGNDHGYKPEAKAPAALPAGAVPPPAHITHPDHPLVAFAGDRAVAHGYGVPYGYSGVAAPPAVSHGYGVPYGYGHGSPYGYGSSAYGQGASGHYGYPYGNGYGHGPAYSLGSF